ncbi:MAG: PleD family two-component system response regulator [Candidatus Odinarchaeota archaeon]
MRVNCNSREAHIEKKYLDYEILIVIEDRSTIEILRCFFNIRGFSSIGIRTGTKSLKQINMFPPKLVLLSVDLPDISGFEICTKIKSNEYFKNVKVYYLVSIFDSNFFNKLKETKADGFFEIPFNFYRFEILLKHLKK